MEIGQVGGPIKVAEGYSVFKIVDREKRPSSNLLMPLQKKRATAYVRINKAQARLCGVHQRFAGENTTWKFFPANIPNMIKDGKFQADN